ncbi:hypothetical protein [Pseudonocardia sp. MH-G8]|uniref:hypothetical protein n=1 Tax=Pseudonocardia sp. MH-G8 TaxID=1854588 RepID=UPI001E591DC5|nr:hypothetical protein [Pseudonocardia sp. MH-G8]
MTETDVAELHALTTPGSPRYLLDDPGYYVLHPTILATGRRSRTGREHPVAVGEQLAAEGLGARGEVPRVGHHVMDSHDAVDPAMRGKESHRWK